MYRYTCVETSAYACTYTYAHAYTYAYNVYIPICICIFIYACTIHIRTQKYIYIHICARIYIYMYVHIHICIYTYTYRYIHMYIYRESFRVIRKANPKNLKAAKGALATWDSVISGQRASNVSNLDQRAFYRTWRILGLSNYCNQLRPTLKTTVSTIPCCYVTVKIKTNS